MLKSHKDWVSTWGGFHHHIVWHNSYVFRLVPIRNTLLLSLWNQFLSQVKITQQASLYNLSAVLGQFSGIYFTYKQNYMRGFCIVFLQSCQYDTMINSVMSKVTSIFPSFHSPWQNLIPCRLLKKFCWLLCNNYYFYYRNHHFSIEGLGTSKWPPCCCYERSHDNSVHLTPCLSMTQTYSSSCFTSKSWKN